MPQGILLFLYHQTLFFFKRTVYNHCNFLSGMGTILSVVNLSIIDVVYRMFTYFLRNQLFFAATIDFSCRIKYNNR